MKPASRLFYLSVFALWAAPGSCESSSDECHISPKSIVGDACASYATLDKLNTLTKPAVDDLTHNTDFFSHYRVNLFHKKCPFWNDENGMCGNIGCAVETLDNEEDIPEIWRAHELGKLEGPRAKHPGKKAQRQHPQRPLGGSLGENVGESCVFEYDDECDERDYCVPEDESASSKGDYVSLVRNPERFTGYAGDGAKQVWDAIYRENCFQKSSFPKSADLGQSGWNRGPAAQDFKQILDAAGRQAQLEERRQENPNTPFVANTGFEVDDECLEKRVFYRVMSGMHASISTHLCWNFLNQTTGEWSPNLSCYEHRLHKFPERIGNVYFNYALMTRAIAKVGPYLQKKDYKFCMGDTSEDAATRAKVLEVTEKAASVPQIFDESLMFVNGEGPSLKEDFRNRFRNVSRLMDCVGCDKCRLWGKLQTAGYGTALKILFELDNNSDDVPYLQRTELVALFNTYARISSSLHNIGQFRQMMEEKVLAEKEQEGLEDLNKNDKLNKKFEEEAEKNPQMDDAVREFIELRQKGPKDDSTVAHIAFELAQFKAAIKIILRGWVRTPKALWHVFTSARTPQKRAGDRRLPISTILGCRFPDQEAICSLLESFFESVHWFSLVIYEPNFRQRLQSIQDGYAYPAETPFLTLLSMVLCMAAWYRSQMTLQESSDGQEWRLWSDDLLKIVESRLVQILDQQSIEAVQTCILLGSHHVYHGRPSLSFALLGATIKISNAIGLHRGHARGSPGDVQERKRVWWTIYTWDRFASISYGRPLSINDKDCNVEMPAEFSESPYFTQQSLQQDLPGIVYSSYQTQLSRLYVLASPALKIIFGSLSARSAIADLESKYASLISEVTHKLVVWRRQLPQHLSLDLTKDVDLGNSDRSYRAHALQSLSLQLTFDNLLIVLHRPFLARQAEHLSTTALTPDNNAVEQSSPFTPKQSPALAHGPESILSQDQASPGQQNKASSEYWWRAAVRTASVTELPQLAQLATNSHLVAFMAMNLFHSAIVLVLVALLNPLSDSAQGVKRTITRVFRLQELLGQRSALSSQSSVVLRNLISLLLQREGEAMLGPVGAATTAVSSQMEQGPGAVEDSAFMSVHDTLRLPLEATLTTSHQGTEGQPWPRLSMAQRLNESLAYVQRVFPSIPTDMSLPGPNLVLEDDVDAQHNSLPLTQHDMSQMPFGQPVSYQEPENLGYQAHSVDYGGNSLFWLWNSTWSADPMF